MRNNKRIVAYKSSRQKSPKNAVPIELESELERSKLNRLDYFIAPLVTIIAAIWTYSYLGTAIEWDDVFYMNLSQYTTPQAWVLNRYGHIYLQKVFFWLTGNAFTGTKVYWCILFFSTCVLIYWCAKLLADEKGYLIGITAVLFFCIQPLFTKFAGCSYSDFTVMFLVTLGSFLYLTFLQGEKKYRHYVLLIFGLIFFWAVKSKETGLCLGVLCLALGQNKDETIKPKGFIRDASWVGLGIFNGFVLLMILDLIFMGDIFFSIRPSSIKELLGFNWFKLEKPQNHAISIFAYFAQTPMLLVFLLYTLVGFRNPNRPFKWHERLLWSLPLTIIIFVTFIRGRWHIVTRYFAPAIPGLCIYAAQFFYFDLTGTLALGKNHKPISKRLLALGSALLAFIIGAILITQMPSIVDYFKMQRIDIFYITAIMPLAILVLVFSAGISRRRGLTAFFIALVSLLLVVYFPLRNNLASLKSMMVAKNCEMRFKPYSVFANEFQFDEDVKIVVSKDVYKRYKMLGREIRAHCWMFNVFFSQKFDYDQFTDGTWEDILKGGYTYALLTWQDWEGIKEKHNISHLLRGYILKSDKLTQLILLEKR